MKFKAIIFDFDGTLFDSERLHLQACNEVFQKLGFHVSEDEYFSQYVGLSDDEMFQLILKNRCIDCEADKIFGLRIAKIQAYKAIVVNSTSLPSFSNVNGFIKVSQQSIDNLAICSNSSRDEVQTTLDKLDNGELKKYFKFIVSIDDVSKGKPSPEGYLLAADRFHLPPEDCLVIEDSPSGAIAAKEAGMMVAALTTSVKETEFQQVDFFATNFDEINVWIERQATVNIRPRNR